MTKVDLVKVACARLLGSREIAKIKQSKGKLNNTREILGRRRWRGKNTRLSPQLPRVFRITFHDFHVYFYLGA